MNILQLSDIHFGRERRIENEHFERRDEVLEKLKDRICSLPDHMKINFIVVTGDIAWWGKREEYEAALVWFRALLDGLGLSAGAIAFCPGNHDVNRSAGIRFDKDVLFDEKGNLRIDEADKCFEYSNTLTFEPLFYNYNAFCDELGAMPYMFPFKNADGHSVGSYLNGYRIITNGEKKLALVCFNTAMMAFDSGLNDDQMLMGQPQLNELLSSGVLNEADFKIALFHHAERYLHPNEQCEYGGRKATVVELMKHMDLSLCGHTETGGMPVMRQNAGSGRLLTAGASYYNDKHPNSFSVIHIDDEALDVDYCSFAWNGDEWECFNPMENYSDWRLSERAWSVADPHTRFNTVFKYGDDEFRIPFRGPDVDFVDSGAGIDYRLETMDCGGCALVFGQNEVDGRLLPYITISKRYRGSARSRLFLADYCEFCRAHQGQIGEYWIENVPDPANHMLVKEFYTAGYAGGSEMESYKALYEDLIKLEEAFDVVFNIPDAITAEWLDSIDLTLSFLKSIVDSGMFEFSRNCSLIEYRTESRETLERLAYLSSKNGEVLIKYDAEISVKFLDARISLGKCAQYIFGMVPADMYGLTRKARSFFPGDSRAVAFVPGRGKETYEVFVSDKFALKADPEWKKKLEADRLVMNIPIVRQPSPEEHMKPFLPIESMEMRIK